MCDCFHLAFPNWHAPAAGAGRRLRGPEQETEDDSVCEEPEILERERPRPQGSSPVEEFPVEKQAEDEILDSAHKSGSNKKSRKAGFGSLFDKRTSDKMNETESGESEMIVKTVKEACVEGLVVTGGGKEGIFIKEVKLDSPASKHLHVKEGDQILSATVYFDNVAYEDALQILEHAQPYKMEFCLRRKVEPTIPENAEIINPKDKDQGTPMMRGQGKMKKQQERISWPKFPSFGKGPRVQFKRSHSTSEAEEHKKLEMSPPTSDTESPVKCLDGKDKKKKHKVQLKMKMKGHRSQSVEEPQKSPEKVLVWENQEVGDILEEKVPEQHEGKIQGIPQVLDGTENEVSSKTGNDVPFQSLSGMELHEAHLISLGNTLKTTNISVALAEGGKIESSEMKVRIHKKEKPGIGTENQTETIKALYTVSDPSTCDNVLLSQVEVEISQLNNDLKGQRIGKGSSERNLKSQNAELSMPNVDICVEETKSPKIGDEKQWKEISMFENESYGFRTRGPLADIATSKTHFANTVNGLQFISSDFSELTQVGKMSDGISDAKKPTVILQPSSSTAFAVDKEDSGLEIKTSRLQKDTDFIQADLDKRSASKFKLPQVDHSGFVTHELIKITEVEKTRTHLPKREDIEIPGMENLQKPKIKVPKIEKMINITKPREEFTDEQFNVEDVKVAVSKFPAFKLPEGDITGVLVQREITIMELKSDKSTLTPRGSPHKISVTSTDSGTSIYKSKEGEEKSPASDTVDKDAAFKMPKVELPYIDEQISTAVIKIDNTQPQITDYGRFGDINFKLPKREDIEIPGMEAIKESGLLSTVVKAASPADLEQAEKSKAKKHGDKKGHEKKSKKPKITIQGSEIIKLDIPSPDISTELPKKDPSKMDTGETKIHEKHKFKTPKIGEVEIINVPVQESKILEDSIDLPQKTDTKFGKTKFKIPPIPLPEFETVPSGEVDISPVDVQVKEAEIILPEDGTNVIKDGQPVSAYGKAQDTETEGQEKKFKLPKFEISFPEVKAPRIICTSKKDDDSSVSEESGAVPVVHSPKAELSDVKPEVSKDLPEVDSEITEVKIKRSGFSFPKFGMSKLEHTAPETDASLRQVDMSLPEGHTEMEDANTNIKISGKDGKQKDATKFGSPTKFKIPSIKFPHFGAKVTKAAMETSDVDVDVKGAEISLPDTELQLSAEPVDIKKPDVEKQKKNASMEYIDINIQREAQGSKFKLPKFGISYPEVKGPKIDISSDQEQIDISVPAVKIQMDTPHVQVGVPEKEMDLPAQVNFPKTASGVSDVDVNIKQPKIGLPETEIKLSAERVSVDLKGHDADKEMTSLSMEMKSQDIQMKDQGSKFKLPKFGISLPDVKGPKIDVSSDKTEIDISLPKAKVEVHPPDVEIQGITAEINADLPEVDAKGLEVKMKAPGFSFPKIGLSKPEVKGADGDVSLPKADVSLPKGSIEIEGPTTDVTVSMEDAELKGQSKFGSPTKFKLPSISFPKFGAKGPKASVEVPHVDVDFKGPELSLPDAEIKLSAEPFSVDLKGPDADKDMKSVSMEIQDQDIQIKEQGSKFKLPKFGISLPDVKGPKIDVSSDKTNIDLSLPKAKLEVRPPDVQMQGGTAEIKADLPEVDSKGLEMKMQAPGFSFPKIGLSKSDVKSPGVDVNLPNVDVSLPKGSIKIEGPTTDVTVSMEDAEQKGQSKFGSPTKFKLPSISFPKFGSKGPKASVEVPHVDVDIKGPEINLPDAEIKLSAEPVSIDLKGPDADKDMKFISMEMKDQDIQSKDEESKFKLPKFGISLPEVKGPKIDVSSDKTDIDLSLPKAKVEVQPPDVQMQGGTAEIKADLPEVDSKGIEMKMKAPGFSLPKIGLSKSDIKAPDVDIRLPSVDVSLPKGSIEIEGPTTDVTASMEDTEQKGQSKFGSPTKFKLPSISFPKFGTRGPKASVEVSGVDIDVKGPELSLPDAEIKLSAEPVSVDLKGPDADKDMRSVSMEIQDQDIQIKEQGSKFKLPKFGISLPEVKGPKIDVSSDKTDIDLSLPKAKVKVHPPDVQMQGGTAEIKADLPEVDSKGLEVKMKAPGFSLPKIGLSKSEVKASDVDVSLPNVDVSLPKASIEIEGPTTDVTVSMEDTEQKGQSKFGSPTKFKLPSISFPKFGTKGPKASVEVPHVDVDVKGPEVSLPDAEIKLSAEPVSVDLKGPDADKEMRSVSMEIQDQDIQIKEQGSKFKLPKFGISLPEVKGPKIDVSSDKTDIDLSLPKAKVKVHPPDVQMQGGTTEIKADLPEVDSKGLEIKMTAPGFSLPKIGLSKSEVKASDVDVSLPNVDVSLPKASIEIEGPTTDVTVSMEDTEQKGQSKFGSPTKFKLPSISFPKFGTKGSKASVEVPHVDVDVKGPEVSLPDAEIKLSAEPVSVDLKGPDADKDMRSVSMEIQDQDIQIKEQGSKFKLPKFGISLPEVKGPKIDVSSDKTDIDLSLPKAKVKVHPPDVQMQGGTAEIKADLPEVDSKGLEMKMTAPGFSLPKIGLSKSDVKASDVDVSLPNVDVSLPKGSIEIEGPTTDVTVSMEDTEQKGQSKFGSPTKFKLPSISFPKFGTKGPKASVEVPHVDVDVKGPEVSLPDAEIKLSAEPVSVDLTGPDADKDMKFVSMEIQDQDIQIKEQGSKFKLPKFGISLPEVKGPKIDVSSDKTDIDLSLSKAKVEVHPPDVELQCGTAEIKADLPEVDSKGLEMKMKAPGFSFPKIGLSKSDVKAPDVDVSLPNVDVSLPKGSIEIEGPTTDVTVSMEDAEQKGQSKFGSPTKFKLPSISFPKFGTKGPKASVEVPHVDVDLKGPEVSLPDAEIKLLAEPVSVDLKGPDADKDMKFIRMEMKEQDIQIKDQESKFKLPKFGISLPDVKGPKIDVSSGKTEIDISLPKAKIEVHPPDVEMQGGTAEIKADLPEVDSKGLEVKMKAPGFSFPKIGLSKPDVKGPDVDVSLPRADVSLPKASIEIEGPTTDVTVSMEDTELKGQSKFGSPTKFKLPSISFPKFGTKGPKASVDVSDVDIDVKGPELSLPDAEIKLSAEPVSVDLTGPDADKEMKFVTMEIQDQDIQIKQQGRKFKLPKFGISLPDVKGPKIDVSSDKTDIDFSLPKAKVEVHPPDVQMQDGTAEIKAELPEVDSKDLEIKMKAPGFSFPKIGLSKSEVKAPDVDVSLPNVDVSLPKGSIEIEGPTTDVTLSMEDAEQKGQSKFGSPTKFKLPSISFPKFGTKGPQISIAVPHVDADVKGPALSLPDAEIKLSAEPVSIDLKGPDADKDMKSVSMEIQDQDIQIKEQGSKFKLPKFGIILPDVKGPKIDVSSDKTDIDLSLPKEKLEVHPPNVELQGGTVEIKPDLPEIDSKGLEVKMKAPGFSFPKIGLSKSDVKAPDVDVSLPNVDVSLPKGSIEIEGPTTDVTVSMEDAEQKGQSKFGSPTKFKLPSISFPKFGTKGPKASVDVPDVDVDVKSPEISLPGAEKKLSAEPVSVDLKGPDVDKDMKFISMEIQDQDIQIKEQGSKFKLPKFGISLPEVKGQTGSDVSSDKTETDISVAKAKVEVCSPDVDLQGVTAEVKADLPEMDSKMKMKRPGLSFPKFSKSDSKAPSSGLNLQTDVSFVEETIQIEGPTANIIEPSEIAGQIGSTKFSSQTKLKFPKFGVIGEKVTVDRSSELLLVDIKGHSVKEPEISIASESSLKPKSSIYLTKEVKLQSLDGKVKNVEINNEVPVPELDTQVGKYGDKDAGSNDNAPDVILEPKEKYIQGVKTSSKFILPTLGDVFSGFDVEFNVPNFDEIEEAKKKYLDPLKDEHNIAVRGHIAELVLKHSQLPKMAEHSLHSDINVTESKKSFTGETDEDNISPTLSLSSSDAFADVSSAVTTEQTGLSLASPTKVKVKYSEPTANAEMSEVHGDIITSTARTELISMEPHQPEKVNIPFSSETSSSSVDTLKRMSGHIVVSNVQSVSKTDHAAIITKADTQDSQTLPPEKIADSVLSVEETIMRKGHTIVEKHVVKEIFGDDKEKIFVTQRIQVFEGDSTEPIADNTASSIQKLRDTVHTEKIRFFEGAQSSKTTIMSTETLLRHADSSTDENGGK